MSDPDHPPFQGFDLSDFWRPSEYALKRYVDAPLTPETLRAVEQQLGYKLPAAYVALATVQNGGFPKRTRHRASQRTSWAHDHIAISGIFAIGRGKEPSLCGKLDNRFWIGDWGYPPIGVYFADCPSAGHDLLCLDYRACGPQGEPRVVHVDQEWDYQITEIAPTFESFIRGLEDERAFSSE